MGTLAHGGLYGTLIELGGVLAIFFVFVLVWLRERRRGPEADAELRE